MAIQFGLDGQSIKIVNAHETESDLIEVLTLTRERYASYVRAIHVEETDKATYWRIVFAILSVHSPLDGTFEAYRAIRNWKARYARIPSQRTLTRLIAMAKGTDGVVLYQNNKSQYIREFDKAWTADRSLFTRNGDSDHEWRLRLWRNVKGLGLAKASFAVCLASPSTSDICCIDTHMHKVFTGITPKSAIKPAVYFALEDRVRELAKGVGLSTFATQWAIWDAQRGQSNPHSVLSFE